MMQLRQPKPKINPMGNSSVTDVQFRQQIELWLVSERVNLYTIYIFTAKVWPRLDISQNNFHFHSTGKGVGLVKGLWRTYAEKWEIVG